jgi:hypothetical protein
VRSWREDDVVVSVVIDGIDPGRIAIKEMLSR